MSSESEYREKDFSQFLFLSISTISRIQTSFLLILDCLITNFNLFNKIMNCFGFPQNTFSDQLSFKLSPLTSAGTLSQLEEVDFIADCIAFSEQPSLPNPINNCKSAQEVSIEKKGSNIQIEMSVVQKEIMDYFDRKGVKIGHPEELKKQYNRKLHKKVSLMVEINQVVIQKAEQGSSLLQRRLKKKMTISL